MKASTSPPPPRDRRGAATDPVLAVAAGRVAFVNSSGGSLLLWQVRRGRTSRPLPRPPHQARRLHRARHRLQPVRPPRRHPLRHPGRPAGSEPATNSAPWATPATPSPPIPLARSHLHWEIGLMLNSRFDVKGRAEKIKPDFGNYNGGICLASIPSISMPPTSRDPGLTMAAYLAALPPACELVLRGKTPDFFRRYPALWKGPPHDGGPIRLTLSESGLPLSGRNATAAELAQLGNQRQAVLRVHPDRARPQRPRLCRPVRRPLAGHPQGPSMGRPSLLLNPRSRPFPRNSLLEFDILFPFPHNARTNVFGGHYGEVVEAAGCNRFAVGHCRPVHSSLGPLPQADAHQGAHPEAGRRPRPRRHHPQGTPVPPLR
jgi:hypothetical protein